MKRVLLIGAGKSTGVLAEYLLAQAEIFDWTVRVVDRDPELARKRVGDHPRGESGELDAEDETALDRLVGGSDLVVSMLPPEMHTEVAQACVHYGSHFVSASYVSPEIRSLDEVAERAGITMLAEVGVDPGIDHMSAMERLDELRGRGARITAFETFTGGLVAPESDTNPWHYKITWNPRNVVLAGQGGVKFKHNGRYKYIPYHQLFRRYERIAIPGWGDFEGYPNRDSLKYRHHYGLYDVETIYRGTLRRPGFCDSWDCLVQLGLTDDGYVLEDLEDMSYRDYVNAYLQYDPDMSVELKVRSHLKLDLVSRAFDNLAWLGLFERRPIGLRRATPAQVLQKLIEEKLALAPGDRDMIVMLHKIEYELGAQRRRIHSWMVCLGTDSVHTAMAKTVGLAAGIGAKLILQGEISKRGVLIPTMPAVYKPILAELRTHGIAFTEAEEPAG